MTRGVTDSPTSHPSRGRESKAGGGASILPITTILLLLIAIWYAGAVYLNAPQVAEKLDQSGAPWGWRELVAEAWSMKRPVLPAPDQVAVELWETIVDKPIDSKRSLVFHAAVTVASAALGLALGALLGIALAIGIVHAPVLERSAMPWIVASQTIPILATAPMIIVVLGSLGLTGLVPKAVISASLCFFPITNSMVKGLRAPDALQLDLMRTYGATRGQVFAKLRWPASFGFLFPSLKVAVALSLVGAIVGELPTGAVAGLGARLLAGSYYGQTVQIWSALLTACALAGVAIGLVSLAERLVARGRGSPP